MQQNKPWMVRLSKKKTCPLERCRFRSGKKPCLFYFEYANGKATCANAKELNENHYAMLPKTEFIMNHTFWVGVAQNNTPEDMKKTSKVIHDFIGSIK